MRRSVAIVGPSLGLVMLVGAALAQQTKKPPVPKGIDPGGVAVAFIGPGVDYTKPVIAERLARDGEGELIGWDVIDSDARPYKLAAFRGIVRFSYATPPEHKRSRIIPVRADPAVEASLARAMSFVAATPARIVNVAMWSGPPKSWEHLRHLAEQHKRLLFVVYAALVDGVPDPRSLLALDNVVGVEVPPDGTFEYHELHAGEVGPWLGCRTTPLPAGDGAMLRGLFMQTVAPTTDGIVRDFRACAR